MEKFYFDQLLISIFVGQNFRRTKPFTVHNFRHLLNILSFFKKCLYSFVFIILFFSRVDKTQNRMCLCADKTQNGTRGINNF